MRIIFHTHYFPPEVGAAQTRIFETSRELARRGHAVTVLTGVPNYPDGVIPPEYRGRPLRTETRDGLRVVRAAVYPAPNRGFARRIANHASFAVSSVLASPWTGPADVVISETPPLFSAAAGVAIARGRRAPLVLNVSDLWPESAVQLGALSHPRAIAAAEAVERFAYRHAALIMVPTPGMVTILRERGLPEERLLFLPNAVDVERFTPADSQRNGRARVIYCGTVGMAQGVGTLLDAARRLEQAGDPIELLIVGDGAERPELEARAREWGLGNVTFAGRVASDRVPSLIATADVATLTLRDVPLFEDALPTKMLEYMAAGKPVAASAAGQVARLLDAEGCGIATPPEDPAALADALRRLVADPGGAAEMGARGRAYVSANLSRAALVARLEQALERTVHPPSR